LELGVCPDCGIKMETEEVKEPRGEYLGFPANELVIKNVCKNCGYTY
jgi:predicted Zn-ribbon and HTH transcriptional regulator